jgi:hypothetical protein
MPSILADFLTCIINNNQTCKTHHINNKDCRGCQKDCVYYNNLQCPNNLKNSNDCTGRCLDYCGLLDNKKCSNFGEFNTKDCTGNCKKNTGKIRLLSFLLLISLIGFFCISLYLIFK